jgi:hypothetical protein
VAAMYQILTLDVLCQVLVELYSWVISQPVNLGLFLSPRHRWGNWSLGGLNNFPLGAQLMRDGRSLDLNSVLSDPRVWALIPHPHHILSRSRKLMPEIFRRPITYFPVSLLFAHQIFCQLLQDGSLIKGPCSFFACSCLSIFRTVLIWVFAFEFWAVNHLSNPGIPHMWFKHSFEFCMCTSVGIFSGRLVFYMSLRKIFYKIAWRHYCYMFPCPPTNNEYPQKRNIYDSSLFPWTDIKYFPVWINECIYL